MSRKKQGRFPEPEDLEVAPRVQPPPHPESYVFHSKPRLPTANEEASASIRAYSQKYRKDLGLSTAIMTLIQLELQWVSSRDGSDAAHSRGEMALMSLLGEQLFDIQKLLTDPAASREACQDAIRICDLLKDNVYACNLAAAYKEQLEGALHARPMAA